MIIGHLSPLVALRDRPRWAVAELGRSVKTLATIIVLVSLLAFSGCSDRHSDSLVGTWQTELIPSEWGSNRITMTFFADGHLVGTNDFRGEGALSWQGTYSVQGHLIKRTIDGRTQEVEYRIDGDTMHQKIGDEDYVFTRTITEPDGAGNSHRAGQ
jgi:hypothetical protein